MRTTTLLALLGALVPAVAATQEACEAAGRERCPTPPLKGALLMQRQPKSEAAALVEEEAAISSEGEEERFANMMRAGDQVLEMAENVVNGSWNMTSQEKDALRMVRLGIQSMLDDALTEHAEDQRRLDEYYERTASCTTEAAASANITRDLNITVESKREMHEVCRELEDDHVHNTSRACWAYDLVRKTNLSDAPPCMFTNVMSAAMVATDVVADRETMEVCLVKIYEWSKELYEYYIACQRRRNETINTTGYCDRYQTQYENLLCEYRADLSVMCESETACLNRERPRYLAEVARIRNSMQARKHLKTAGVHILCYFNVFNATTPAEANRTLAVCKAMDVNTSDLDINFRALPTSGPGTTTANCTPMEAYPCTAAFMATYTSAPWYQAAPTAPCTPCPTPPPAAVA